MTWLPLTVAILLQQRLGLPEDPAAPVFISFLQTKENDTAKVRPTFAPSLAPLGRQANGTGVGVGAAFWHSRPLPNTSALLQLRAPTPRWRAPPDAGEAPANTSVDALLQLSESVLDQLPLAAQLLPGLANASAGPERRQEEKTLAALASHSGQLEKLFHQLADEMESGDGDEEQREAAAMAGGSLAAAEQEAGEAVVAEEAAETRLADKASDRVLHLFSEDAPEAHRYDEAGIGEQDHHAALHLHGSLAEQPTMTGAYGKRELRAEELDAREHRVSGARLGIGVLLAFVLAAGTASYCFQERLLGDAKEAADDAGASPRLKNVEPREGKTSYVVRIARVRVEGLQAQALAWQLQVGDQQPRPSRFSSTWIWDAPVDRLDVDVDNPTEKISFSLLEQSASLMDPPRTVATVELPAGVLLAEARKHVEKVKSSRQADQYVHEKRFTLPGGGSLILEYSLIAFFHWYVGGAEHTVR